MGNIRILIADDQEGVREGVRELLAKHPGWEVCGEAVDGRNALERAKSLKPDVIVLDYRIPKLNGLEAVPLIKKELQQNE